MQQLVRLLFFHQNCLFRQLLVQVFSDGNRFQASDVDHVRPDHRQQILAGEPDVVLLELSLPQKLSS